MKKLTVIITYGLLAVLQVHGADPFTLSFTTVDYGSNPNILAGYVTQGSTYINTIGVYTRNKYITKLSNWRSASGISSYSAVDADAYMGATRSNFNTPSPVVFSWDFKDKNGVVVADGTYTVNLEIVNENQGRKFYSFSFAKDGVTGTRTVANHTCFTGISIAYANVAPVAEEQRVSTAEDTAKAITLTATDTEGASLTYSIVSVPSHGSLSGSAPDVTYTPSANYNGSDSFTFKANDGNSDSSPATVGIIVNAVNDGAPVAEDKSAISENGNPVSIMLSATDVDDDPITYSIVAPPTSGHLFGTPPDLAYAPVKGMTGPISFTYNADDGVLTGNTATVSVSLVFTDTSGNGIPDSWQAAYGVTNAAADPDQDGLSNYEEYLAGTNPTNSTSVFTMNPPQLPGGSDVVLQWNSVQYNLYSIQSSTNLLSGWNTIGSNLVATPPVNSYTGSVNSAVPAYYRISLEP